MRRRSPRPPAPNRNLNPNPEAEIDRKDFEVATLAKELEGAQVDAERLKQLEAETEELREKLQRAAAKAGKANQALLDAQMKNMSPSKESESSGGFFGGSTSPRGVSQKVVDAAAGQIDHLKRKVKELEGERDTLQAEVESIKGSDRHYQELHQKMTELQDKTAKANGDLLEAQQKQLAATRAQKKEMAQAKKTIAAQAKEIEELKMCLHASQEKAREAGEELRKLGKNVV